jgi:ribose transport system ATP-binding protein
MHSVSKSFGATQALRGVSLSITAGKVHALIGENGAGKSTLMKVLSGAIRPDTGTMQLNGQAYAPTGPQAARQAGVAMIYQELNLAPDLSVEDNIMLGQEVSAWGVLKRGEQQPRVREALELLGHGDLKLNTPVRHLSLGVQQLVEVARALVAKARLIVFDEPTSSLTQRDAEHLFKVIGRLSEKGLGIVYISHFLEEVRNVCDSYTVLRDGQHVGSGSLAGVSEAEIVSLMVGRNVDDLFPAVPHQPGEVLLSLNALSGQQLPHDATLTLRRGEILGIAGLVGAGRTELLRTIFALDPIRSGSVTIKGHASSASTASRIAAGLGMVSEDRKGEGLAQNRSIADNLTLSRLKPYSRFGLLNLGRREQAAADYMRRLQVKAESPRQPVQALSGGNQQKVAIARVMHQQADILLLDEPTRGIDVGTKAEIYRLIGQAAAAGKAVIFVSSYLPELLAVCDTLGVMSRGRLRAIRPVSQWTEEEVMAEAIRVA